MKGRLRQRRQERKKCFDWRQEVAYRRMDDVRTRPVRPKPKQSDTSEGHRCRNQQPLRLQSSFLDPTAPDCVLNSSIITNSLPPIARPTPTSRPPAVSAVGRVASAEGGSLRTKRQPIKFHGGYKYGRGQTILQIMGKRAPKAEKAEKGEAKKAERKEEVSAEDAHFEVFTPKFYETLDSFKDFYKEVLALKAKDGDSAGFGEVRKRVSGRLEAESSNILKEELADLEKWIVEQQGKLAGETTKIEEAYKATSASLTSTGSFTDEEIRRQLQPIQAKIDEKNATHASFGELLKRAKDIYE